MRIWGYYLFCGVFTAIALWGLNTGLRAIATKLDAVSDPVGLAIFLLICLLAFGLMLAMAFIADLRAGRGPGRGRARR